MIKKLNKNYKGLTLMETVINIYVYTLLIMVCMAVSISYIRVRSQLRQSQLAVEEISLVMNQMAKEIRMNDCSTTMNPPPPQVWYPNRCIMLGSISGITWNFVIYQNGSNSFVFVTWGGKSVLNDANSNLVLEDVGGSFSATNAENAPFKIPLITIKMWKYNKDGTKMPGTDVQTSVSMRSGYEANTN